MILAHARFDPTADRRLGEWVGLLAGDPELANIIRERVSREPSNVFWLRAERDSASAPSAQEAVCVRHRGLASGAPGDGDLRYVATRCIADPRARAEAFLAGHAAHPDNPWFASAAGYEHARRGEWAAAVALFDRGRSPELAAIRATLWVDAARVRRVAAPGDAALVSLTDLSADSGLLSTYLAYEPGASLPSEEAAQMVRPWLELARGSLDTAVRSPGLAPEQRAELLRLVAASEGVAPDLAMEAWSLGDEEGIGDISVWPTIAVAMREGRDATPFIDAARRVYPPEEIDALLRVLDVGALEADPVERMNEIASHLLPFLRGEALVMGIVLLGEGAPEEWRHDALGLLFTRERPFFRGPRARDDVPSGGVLGDVPGGLGLRGGIFR
jgi:hypothetical protein